MNKDQRKQLGEALKAFSWAQEIIAQVAEEEREKFDNLTEGLQQAENGQKMEEAADILEEVSIEIDNLVSRVEEVMR